MLKHLEMSCSESRNYCFGCGIASRMQKQSKSGSTSPASHTWQMISQLLSQAETTETDEQGQTGEGGNEPIGQEGNEFSPLSRHASPIQAPDMPTSFQQGLKMLPLKQMIEGTLRTAVQGLDAEMPLRYNDTSCKDIEHYFPVAVAESRDQLYIGGLQAFNCLAKHPDAWLAEESWEDMKQAICEDKKKADPRH